MGGVLFGRIIAESGPDALKPKAGTLNSGASNTGRLLALHTSSHLH
jgi:hypothetical protein